MKSFRVLFFALAIPLVSFAQYQSQLGAKEWVDSVFKTLSKDERITQLMVVRAHSNLGPDHVAKVTEQISKYNVGGLCFFQGGPVRQANLTNFYQSISRIPLLITIDGEWGVGMRLDTVKKYPFQLTVGAIDDDSLVYQMGESIGEQCKRLGIQINYAPDVDINNNPANPVIGYRSFGESRDKVAEYGVAMMKGMQAAGIMACAKHFPGHGDVAVDSHYDLPVVSKSISQLASMELVPFKALIDNGVGSVMTAHLSVPSVDPTPNTATSMSKNTVTGLLRDSLKYQGLTFTDALEMKGVTKYFPGGKISAQALIAGNDMLCLPEDVEQTIIAVRKAIKGRKLKWSDIDLKVKKVLMAKYQLGLNKTQLIDTANLLNDLDKNTDKIRTSVAEKSITLLSQARNKTTSSDYADIPVSPNMKRKIAYVGIGSSALNAFGRRLSEDFAADTFLLSYKDSAGVADLIADSIMKSKYDAVIIGIHGFNNRPARNYDISEVSMELWRKLNYVKTITLVFGNVLATANFCNAYTLVACYQDDDITHQAAADIVEGKAPAMGHLPVTICGFKYGYGITENPLDVRKKEELQQKLRSIDTIALAEINQKAYPGCVVLAMHNGEIIYNKAFGNYEYGPSPVMSTESVFDLASVTKISATTLAIMKLYEEKKVDLNKTLGAYLPAVKNTDKSKLRIDDILLHQAGLVSFISFYKETIDPVTGAPRGDLYSNISKPGFSTRVAEGVYLRNDFEDTLIKRILKSPLGPKHKYVYSDNDFIFLGKIVEQISGMPLDEYVSENFYSKLKLESTGFKPRLRLPLDRLVPTETEINFRRQMLRGDVHDEGSSLFGGVAGHAGLFSDAYDLAKLYQMLLNGGEFEGVRYFKPETIKLFTAYHSDISRRGYGFDKPEKDNAKRSDPYPAKKVPLTTFGHTGFTGTCVWVDPTNNIIYIFLSNRVYPTRENPLLLKLNIRGKIQDAIYSALGL